MSNVVSALVKKRRVGSPTRKAVLMHCADAASDDGTGIWASKATIARDLELGRRTVQVAIDEMMEAGLIEEVGKRRCAHGFTVEYRINLEAVKRLDPTKPDGSKASKSDHPELPLTVEKERCAGAAPVQELHPTRAGAAPQDVQELHPNHTGTIIEPLCDADVLEAFEAFWNAYPRRRDRAVTFEAYRKAIGEGGTPEAIMAGLQKYRSENADNIRGGRKGYIAYSMNWLRDRRWEDAGEDHQRKTVAAGPADQARFWADRVKAGKTICGNAIKPPIARLIRDMGLLTHSQMIGAGGELRDAARSGVASHNVVILHEGKRA